MSGGTANTKRKRSKHPTQLELAQKFIEKHGDEFEGLSTELTPIDYVAQTVRPDFWIGDDTPVLTLADIIPDRVGSLPAGLLGESLDNFKLWRGERAWEMMYRRCVLDEAPSALRAEYTKHKYNDTVQAFIMCARWTHAKMVFAPLFNALVLKKRDMPRWLQWLTLPNSNIVGARLNVSRRQVDYAVGKAKEQLMRMIEEHDIDDGKRLHGWLFAGNLFIASVAGHSALKVPRPPCPAGVRRDSLRDIKKHWPSFQL